MCGIKRRMESDSSSSSYSNAETCNQSTHAVSTSPCTWQYTQQEALQTQRCIRSSLSLFTFNPVGQGEKFEWQGRRQDGGKRNREGLNVTPYTHTWNFVPSRNRSIRWLISGATSLFYVHAE
mmetsp:Transcript_40019/g.78893  ORF Transcript_40019/g.78893 Transcript_40019/m.78893 type:complete len:122 (+) Transcript_40019:159-524(+)